MFEGGEGGGLWSTGRVYKMQMETVDMTFCLLQWHILPHFVTDSPVFHCGTLKLLEGHWWSLNGRNWLVWPRKYAHSSVSSLVWSLLPKDTLLRTYLTSLQLVTGNVWRRWNVSLPFTVVYILFYFPLGSWGSLWNFETIRGSLVTPKWQKLASLAQEICTF